MSKIKIISSILTICMLFTTVTMQEVYAQNNVIVYEAEVTNGNDVFGDKEECTFAGGTVKMNFRYGTVSVITLPSEVSDGETAYANIPNGKSFLFSYILHPETGKVDVAIDGEIKASGTCTSLKGAKTISTDWYTKYTKVGPNLNNDGFKTLPIQEASVLENSTAMVKISLNRAIPYNEIKKISIKDENGSIIKIIDYIKSNKEITFYTESRLNINSSYTLCGSNIYDIYGETSDILVNFIPTVNGEIKTGKDLKLANDVARAWSFERRIDWHEETNLLKDNGWSIGDCVIGTDNSNLFYMNLYKMKVSREHVTHREYSLRWDNHPYYSTLATDIVEKDWTGANMFNLSIYSEQATGEIVNILVYSDNPDTPWKDGYNYPLTIDWVGEKELNIPLNEFESFENPVGFNNVSAIYFSTKMYNCTPNPDTVLYLDNMHISYNNEYPITPTVKSKVVPENTHRGIMYSDALLNHEFDEVKNDAKTPFEYESYNKTERALFGYFPKYNPGMASFDKDGKVYIKCDGTRIQYLDENNKWKVISLDPFVKQYGRVWDGGSTDEPVVRFDNDGWAYVLVTTDKGSILLWSSDGMKTWKQKYIGSQTTYFNSRFEHIDGNNVDAMNNPPLILLHAQQSDSNRKGTLLIPTKTSNGGLSFRYIEYTKNCITPQAHTGDGNFVVSKGGYAYVIYSIYEYNKILNPVEKIPQNHIALSMEYNRDGQKLLYKNGCPTFIRKINLSDGSMSEPVFVGFGGVTDDDHNWPGISIDSKGYLHVIMNGHHDPIAYTTSKNPYDITSWNNIELIGGFSSYGTIMIDKKDSVHIMVRDASRGYRFDTSVWSKSKDGVWEKSYIVKRKAPYYEVARQRMSYNNITDEYWVHYYSQSSYFEVFQDEYEAILFTWPNEEKNMLTSTINGGYNVSPQGTDRMQNKKKCYWEFDDAGDGREGVLIRSSDGCKSFSMVKTEDCK